MTSSASEKANGMVSVDTTTGKRRYIIAIGLLAIACLGYMDRVNFSVAAPYLIKEFSLSTGEFGVVTSIFNWIYVALLIPFGMIADRRGARLVLPLSIVVWSIGSGMTGAAFGLGALIIARLVLGAGESPIYPVGNVVVREWAPVKERGVFAGTLNAGSLVGPAIGAVATAYLVVALGWRGSFFVLGGLGVVLGLVWFAIYNAPEKTKWLSDGERTMILAHRESSTAPTSSTARMSVAKLLRIKTVWGLMITQGCAVYTNYLFLSFLPLYLVTERGLKVLSSGWVTGGTYGIAAVGSVTVAIFSDKVLKNAEVVHGGRRKSVAVALLVTLPLFALPWITNIVLIIALVSWVLIMVTAAISLNFALASDLIVDRSSSGRVFALVTIGGNIFGLLAPIVTGYLVDWTGNYTVPFVVAALLLLVGAVVTWTMSRRPLQPKVTG